MRCTNNKIIRNLNSSDQTILKSFGLIIRQERLKNGWTLEDTEDNGYPSSQHWQAVESGLKNISFTTVLNIARTLKVQPYEIFKQINIYD